MCLLKISVQGSHNHEANVGNSTGLSVNAITVTLFCYPKMIIRLGGGGSGRRKVCSVSSRMLCKLVNIMTRDKEPD